MAFTKLSISTPGAATVPNPSPLPEQDIWSVFRALRDARDCFGLRPGHMHTLQAMLSFLKPGQGDTVFASNTSICQRVGGIDERTLRRHINRFVQLGFIRRNDSSNKKRYRVRASSGESISYGLSLAPLFGRASELFLLAQEVEQQQRDKIFVRKQILTGLACIEDQDPTSAFVQQTRKALRRKLNICEYKAILAETNAQIRQMSTAVDMQETTKLSANHGQIVRHQSRSLKERKDIDEREQKKELAPQLLISVCKEATSFATSKLRNWIDIHRHAETLAPMIGIHPEAYANARKTVGAQKASCAIFIILKMGNNIRDCGAYFHSITLGQRRNQFDPLTILNKFAKGDMRSA